MTSNFAESHSGWRRSIDQARRLSSHARDWATTLTLQQSVTGTPGEAAFGPWLAERLRSDPVFDGAEIWTIPVAEGDPRQCMAMLMRGSGRGTVILTGHYDTVSIDDYGDLRPVATDPKRLLDGLRQRLAKRADTPAALRAKADFSTQDFLPGRGLLDMKAGLAAGLAASAAFFEAVAKTGNVLFLAVPDEENNSAGARRAAQELPRIAGERDLDFVAAINLDAIADDGDGSQGRIIALGTVGKVLPTACVVGIPAHSGFPLNGVNAATLAAAIAARVEWASELTDAQASLPGTPPSLLSMRDGKSGYDVTTPATAFVTFNVLNYRRTTADVLERFDRLCREAASSHLDQLRQRIAQSGHAGAANALGTAIPIHRYEQVEAEAVRVNPGSRGELQATGGALAAGGLSLPEQCLVMTEQAWRLSQLPGPAVVTGFGSIPYLPTNLSDSPAAARLRAIALEIAATAEARYGVAIGCTDYFAGISDMSFLGEADEGEIDVVARNTPMWRAGVRWPDKNGVGNIPTINAGPWGRDYHTPLERLHVGYAFEVLPHLIGDLVEALLGSDAISPIL